MTMPNLQRCVNCFVLRGINQKRAYSNRFRTRLLPLNGLIRDTQRTIVQTQLSKLRVLNFSRWNLYD